MMCTAKECVRPAYAKGACKMHYSRLLRSGAMELPDVKTHKSGWGKTEKYLRAEADHCGDDCLIWPFGRDGGGYARANVPGFKTRLAHRIMCEMAHGAPPSLSTLARHLCGRGHEGCVNPKHLSWGSHADNYADMVVHGNNPIGERIGRSVLTEPDVLAIREMQQRGVTQRELARDFGVSSGAIQAVIERRSWRHIA